VLDKVSISKAQRAATGSCRTADRLEGCAGGSRSELELGRGYSPAVRAATQGRGRTGTYDLHVDSRLGELHAKVRVR